MYEVVLHLVVDGINASLKRLQQSAASDNGVELQLDAGLLKTLEDEITTIFVLVTDMMECGKLAHRMVCTGHPYRLFVFINSKFS